MTSVAAPGTSRRPRTSSICLGSAIPLLLVGSTLSLIYPAASTSCRFLFIWVTDMAWRAGTSNSVVDYFALTPPKIEQHFGISRGHIHCVDNGFRCVANCDHVWCSQVLTHCCCAALILIRLDGDAASWQECLMPRQCQDCTQPAPGRIRQALSWAALATTAPGRSSLTLGLTHIGKTGCEH